MMLNGVKQQVKRTTSIRLSNNSSQASYELVKGTFNI